MAEKGNETSKKPDNSYNGSVIDAVERILGRIEQDPEEERGARLDLILSKVQQSGKLEQRHRDYLSALLRGETPARAVTIRSSVVAYDIRQALNAIEREAFTPGSLGQIGGAWAPYEGDYHGGSSGPDA